MSRPITVALPTTDRQRSYDFYREALGLEPVGEPAEDGVPEPLQFRLDEHVTLMLIPTGGFGWALGGRDVALPGLSEVLLSVTAASTEEVWEIVKRMHAAGGEVLTTPEQQDWGFTAVVTDPDGHAWQIMATTRT